MDRTVTWTCTGCALLCEDISVSFIAGRVDKIEHACIRGRARISGCRQAAKPTIDHNIADTSEAIAQAANILKKAKNPLIYGFSNSTSEAQLAGIDLARKLGAVIDSTSSFCQGITVNEILNGNIPSCTLEDVREKADVLVFWGADPMSSHPRHMSRYSYFPRGDLRQRGYEEDRVAISIDVWQSRTAKICKDRFYSIPPGGDAGFMQGLIDALSGLVPRLPYEYDVKRILELAAILKKAEFGVIFAGLGLIYSIKSQMQLLNQFIAKLNEHTGFYLIPMSGHFNMRGFNHALYEQTGFVHRVKFTDNGVLSGPEYSVLEQLKNGADAAIIVGSDPLGSLPGSISKRLAGMPVIQIDPCVNLTSRAADVTIPCGVAGIDVAGTAVRMDGKTVEISALQDGKLMSDEEIIRNII